jgi:hypothetical protein
MDLGASYKYQERQQVGREGWGRGPSRHGGPSLMRGLTPLPQTWPLHPIPHYCSCDPPHPPVGFTLIVDDTVHPDGTTSMEQVGGGGERARRKGPPRPVPSKGCRKL